ncbi:MAG: RBBP9/YdeN family alpha/beta hydrolase [Gemmatimonadaceae bacterium]
MLTIPGWTGSGPEHWQSRWERADPGIRRVEQADWDAPAVADWVAALDASIREVPAPPVLVAHSLGCLTVAHWAARAATCDVVGALLVAPPDVEHGDTPAPLRPFAPVPRDRLPFVSVVVASRDDPFCSFDRAAAIAAAWGAEFVDAGHSGHLNTAAGLGEWPAGQALLRALQTRVLRL